MTLRTVMMTTEMWSPVLWAGSGVETVILSLLTMRPSFLIQGGCHHNIIISPCISSSKDYAKTLTAFNCPLSQINPGLSPSFRSWKVFGPFRWAKWGFCDPSKNMMVMWSSIQHFLLYEYFLSTICWSLGIHQDIYLFPFSVICIFLHFRKYRASDIKVQICVARDNLFQALLDETQEMLKITWECT